VTATNWERINRLFHEALMRPESHRASFLATECGNDRAVRAEVESLLAMHRDGENDVSASLAVGSRIGEYDITGFIAAGGMGDVYRARDTKSGREAALKVLPQACVADPDRRARFDREADTLVSLSHPHIAAIYGMVEEGPISALALELVEGETLAGRIARGSLHVDEALQFAREIAEALEAAHARGIVHGDLKPANVAITHDAVVKVLDFGVARMTDSSTDAIPAGLWLGTPAYMSPEQARGEEADEQSDIWAFGCVLYEMLTGRRAFEGATVADTIAYVLASEAVLDALPNGVSPRVRMLIGRCLAKDRARRIPDASDIQFFLREMPVQRAETWLARTLSRVHETVRARRRTRRFTP